MDRAATYQLSMRGGADDRKAVSFSLQGKTFIAEGAHLEGLLQRHYSGWVFQWTRLSDTYGPKEYMKDLHDDALIIAVLRKPTIGYRRSSGPPAVNGHRGCGVSASPR